LLTAAKLPLTRLGVPEGQKERYTAGKASPDEGLNGTRAIRLRRIAREFWGKRGVWS
jgi:hypothetical protein